MKKATSRADLSELYRLADACASSADLIRQTALDDKNRNTCLLLCGLRENSSDAKEPAHALKEVLNTTRSGPSDVVRVGPITAPNAHNAVIALATDIVLTVWRTVAPDVPSRAFPTTGLSAAQRKEVAATEMRSRAVRDDQECETWMANWPRVRAAILAYPECDVGELRAQLRLERSAASDKKPRSTLYDALGGPPTPLQKAIWAALDGRAMKTDELAVVVAGGDKSRLYYTDRKNKTGGLKEMRGVGCVDHKHGVGHFRPDAPPATN